MAKATITSDLSIDLNKWTMKDFTSFTKSVSESDFETVAPLAAKAITSWPYEGEPSEPATWDVLSMVQVAHILNVVRKAVELVFSEGN